MPRPRLAFLRSFLDDVGEARNRARRRGRRSSPPPQRPDGPTGDELARRLDETRERLRRDIPPRGDDNRP
ncbi:MAG: hypothetical protein ACRDLQ_10580 [Solirubrobacterales bacterium]